MRRWLDDWPPQIKFALVVVLASLLGLSFSFIWGGFVATLVITLPALFAILKAIGPALNPSEGGGRSKIALASLGIAALAVLSGPFWKAHINQIVKPLLEGLPESIRATLLYSQSDAPSVIALIFLAFVIVTVNYFARDKTALRIHPEPIDKDFPERKFTESLERYARWLGRELDKIDIETNWTDENFVALDAEVEVRGTYRRRRITELLRAIRHDRKSKIFLVLGDPGAGKSVTLRKLCRDLLKEVRETGRLSVYVNLREWEPRQGWTEEAPPTGQELYEFVLANLKSRADVFGSEFLDKYFRKMLDRGRLFLILDSFDEIPPVLDVDEGSWLIGALSDALDQFLTGAHDSRGVVASRLYRKPNDKLGAMQRSRSSVVFRPKDRTGLRKVPD